MKTLKVKWTGIRPLLMHSAAMIDPDNKFVRAKETEQRRMKKLKKDDYEGREKCRRLIEELEWTGSLYWDEAIGLYLPGDLVMACIVEGAMKSRAGKQAKSAIVPLDDMIPLKTAQSYPKDLKKLYAVKDYSLRFPVRIPPKTGSRIMIVRPLIPTGWSIDFDLEFEESVFPYEDAKEANLTSGRLIGAGAWRPKFGRFEATFEN